MREHDADASTGRNIVVFSDGTGQDGGVRPEQRLSNVYKLYRASRIGPDSPIDPARQVAFYDAGLGTDDDVHGVGSITRSVKKFLAQVAGRGIGTNIADCYEFIINHWRPADRIYIVGFSRGAYTARCIAQVLSLCGVPTHAAGDFRTPFPRFTRASRLAAERAVHQVYEHGAGLPIKDFEAERDEQARRFRTDFGSDQDGHCNGSPYFIGVFDTVAALGAKGWKRWGLLATMWGGAAVVLAALAAFANLVYLSPFWPAFATLIVVFGLAAWITARRDARRYIDNFPTQGSPRHVHYVGWHADNYDRGLSGHVGYARQASAADEDRADFPRVVWGKKDVIRQPREGEPPPLVQLWFPGNHSDVGGSYPEPESRLSDIALQWMIDEAESLPHPLLLNHDMLHVSPDPAGLQHSEVQSMQDRTLWRVPKWAPGWLRQGWPLEARKPAGYPLHPSIHARFASGNVVQGIYYGPYRPQTFSTDARFAHFYDGSDSLTPKVRGDIEVADYRIDGEPPISFRANVANAGLASLMKQHAADDATILLVSTEMTNQDLYGDALALREMARAIPQRPRQPLSILQQISDCQVVPRGLMVFGMPAPVAAAAARRAGRPFYLSVDAAGYVKIEPASAEVPAGT